MNKLIRCGAGVIASALLISVAPSAHANADDGVAALVTNTLDQLSVSVQTPDPNVTCDVNAGGREAVQHTNYVVGEVYGQDAGEAYGECVSLDRSRVYTIQVRVQLEYFTRVGLTGGFWTAIPGCFATVGATSIAGVAAPLQPALRMCTYAGPSPYLNRYHRAHGILTTSVAGVATRHSYSPIWFMAP